MGWSGVLILRHPTPLYGPETKGGVDERAGLEKKLKKGPLDQRKHWHFSFLFCCCLQLLLGAHSLNCNMGEYVPHVDQQAFDELECC